MVGLGLLEPPERGPRPDGEALGAIQQFLGEQRGAAEFIGEWAFYAAVLLIALALIKRFPYRLFVKTHKLLAVVYVALVLHSVVLMDVEAWIQPIGLMTGILMAAGVISALLVLLDQIGKGQEVQGTIESLLYVPEMRVLETVIRLDDGWQGHQGGQFAFVTFDRKEGQHPFTIASAWDPAERRIMFITKALGDYTDFLPDRLNAGDQVKVEGPYGRFTFDDGNRRQIWIGGGIGITPFIARMKQLAQAPDDQAIDLFHTVADDLDPVVKNKLNADVAASKVNLHLMIDSKDGFLTADRLRDMVPDWKDASVWFCGPAGFGHALRKDLTSSGLAAKDFHQELFNMR
jgi:predicted ferric reductase